MRAQEPTPGHTHTVKRKLKGASRGNAVARSTPGSTPLAFVTPCPLGMHFSPHLRRKMRCCAAAIQGSFNTTRTRDARAPKQQALESSLAKCAASAAPTGATARRWPSSRVCKHHQRPRRSPQRNSNVYVMHRFALAGGGPSATRRLPCALLIAPQSSARGVGLEPDVPALLSRCRGRPR